MKKKKRMVGWVRWFDNDEGWDTRLECGCFFLFFSFLPFSFFCSFLSFLLHTSGGRKAVPWGLHIDGSYGGRSDRERQIERDRSKGRRMVVLGRRKRKNQILRVLFCPVLTVPFSSKLLNSHPYSSLPTNPQQFIPHHHIHQSQSHTFINHISPRQPLFQTRILL